MATISRLSLRDFRNFERVDLDFPAAGIVVVGDNGQGKTNLLEAVYYFQLLRSMRGARDADLIRFGATTFHIACEISTAGPRNASAAFNRGGRKKIVVDGSETKRLSDALGSLPAVVVSPRDVDLVIGSPAERRRYLDVTLALTSRRYLSALQTYRAALARRNAALRSAARDPSSSHVADSIEVWEPALASSGAVLLAERTAWMERNGPEFERLTSAIGETSPMSIRYASTVSSPSDARVELAESLERKRAFDIRRGVTHVGPHRDDLVLTNSGHELRVFGSGGQARTAAIALRLIEAAAIRGARDEQPVLLLDDPFAELDARRSARVLELLHSGGDAQTILTVPRGDDVPADFRSLERWTMRGGTVMPATRSTIGSTASGAGRVA